MKRKKKCTKGKRRQQGRKAKERRKLSKQRGKGVSEKEVIINPIIIKSIKCLCSTTDFTVVLRTSDNN